ncbi:AAA family ATPase [Zavarzinella formosa]|uniref:AAA family ATPase n=1 Tax=Zavarzinella formosa TaxID=360055 RepID=UPI00031D554B|nr:ATP-binding protein [Zavarzinella formosa]
MIIEFRAKNYRSLRDEQVFTLEGVSRAGEKEDPRLRKVPGYDAGLLPVACFYGGNASGKTNLLSAMAYMRIVVLDSHRAWMPDGGVPRDPFAWGPTRNEPSVFEITFLIEGVRYQFGFSATDQAIEEEWLYAWPQGRRQVWYERDGNEFSFKEHLVGEKKLIQEFTRPNSLFLSAAVQNRHPQLSPIYTWFRSWGVHGVSVGQRPTIPAIPFSVYQLFEEGRQPTLFDDEWNVDALSEQFLNLVRNADIGITDVKVIKNDSSEGLRRKSRNLLLKHLSSHDESWLPLEEESKGTRTIFNLALPILRSIHTGTPLLVDELESSLHPKLAIEIVSLFNNPARNPHNAQLIFTTHDTNLLGTTIGDPALRRDQVWLAEKDLEGASIVYPLTDFTPRKEENLERGYLQGRYGAIPFLGNFANMRVDEHEQPKS